ncbi:hypothetical protein ElyMa_000293500, partial [Elysia marginata]
MESSRAIHHSVLQCQSDHLLQTRHDGLWCSLRFAAVGAITASIIIIIVIIIIISVPSRGIDCVTSTSCPAVPQARGVHVGLVLSPDPSIIFGTAASLVAVAVQTDGLAENQSFVFTPGTH